MTENAQAGIGEMVLLIGSLLVAAIAGSTFLASVDGLGHLGSVAGGDASRAAVIGVRFESAAGIRTNSTGPLTALDVYVSVAPGSPDLDLTLLRIELRGGSNMTRLHYTPDSPTSDEFAVDVLRDADPTFDETNPFLDYGDAAKISFNLTASGSQLPVQSTLEVRFIPGRGSAMSLNLLTPATYGTALRVDLY